MFYLIEAIKGISEEFVPEFKSSPRQISKCFDLSRKLTDKLVIDDEEFLNLSFDNVLRLFEMWRMTMFQSLLNHTSVFVF